MLFSAKKIQHSFNQVYSKSQNVVSNFVQQIHSLKDEYFDHIDTVEKLRSYKADVERLSKELNDQSFLKSQNKELRKLVQFTSKLPNIVLTTKIISGSVDNFIGKVILPVGSQNGVRVGMSVVNKSGVLGRIENVGDNFSDVLLITDPNSKIVGLNPKTTEKMIISGSGNDNLQAHFVENDHKMKVGDIIYTTGEGGYFPEGLPVGEIIKIHHSNILLKPMFEMNRVFYVQVIGNQMSLEG